MRTGPSRKAVSNLGLKPRTTCESPNSPGGVMAKAIMPHSQLVNVLSPSDLFVLCLYKFSDYLVDKDDEMD